MIKRLAFITGLLLLIIAITDLVIWIIIAAPEEKTFDEAVNEYTRIYPKFISSPTTLTLLNVLLLLIAIGCFIFSIQKSRGAFFRRFCYVLIILSGVFAFWNLFSLL